MHNKQCEYCGSIEDVGIVEWTHSNNNDTQKEIKNTMYLCKKCDVEEIKALDDNDY